MQQHNNIQGLWTLNIILGGYNYAMLAVEDLVALEGPGIL